MTPRTSQYRVGFDIGGTFTDFVLSDAATGAIRLHKCLTTPDDPARGALEGMGALLARAGLELRDVDEIVHGTTLVTNAIIERKGARTALVTTRGFRDVLEAGFEQRYDVHDLFLKFPDPLVPRRWRFEATERMTRDGDVATPLDVEGIKSLAGRLADEGIEAVAICFLHSYRNPAHELAVGRLLAAEHPDLFVSLSSEVVAELREYERTCTTCANAFVQPLMARYLHRLESALASLGFRGRLSLMLSSGGLTTAETARRFPIRLLESGPAGGALATSLVGRGVNRPDLIGFDMGGTTAKAVLLENYEARISPQMEAARVQRFKKGSGLPIKTPVIDMIEIGAGGGSIASIDELGLLKVGPASAGADPGPICYGLGGASPTVTDANLTLGYLDPGSFLGGEMALERTGAEETLARLGEPLGLDGVRAAWGVYQIVCENMAAAARVHIVEKGRDPRNYAMVAIGGAGPAHAARVARLIGLREVIIPQASGAASALGFLAAPASFEAVRSSITPLDADIDARRVEGILAEIEREARQHVDKTGAPASGIVIERTADMRLQGQFHEISVALPDGAFTAASIDQVRRDFTAAYERLYNTVLPGVIEVISWRVRAKGPAPSLSFRAHARASDLPAAVKGRRPAFFGSGYVEAVVYNRYALSPGDRIAGPAIIEERESTTIVPPTDVLEIDAEGNLWIRLGDIASPAPLLTSGMTLARAMQIIESDPVGLEIMWSRMVNITEQCWTTVCRTAFSLIIGVAQDFSVEILDRNGDTVASNPRGQPSFDLCMPVAARAMLERFPPETLEPGDVLATNDPWLGAGHLDDIAIFTPIFHKDVFVGLIGSIGHVTDIGGVKSAFAAAELFEEGLQIPPLKIFRRGQRNEDIFSMISQNVRESEQVIGDILALVGANAIGARGVVELLEEYGLHDLVAFGRIVQGRSEAAMRRAISATPDGDYRSEISVDVGGQLMTFPVEITVAGDSVVIDLDGAPPQAVRGGFNSTLNYTSARAKNPVKCLLTPHIRANEGCYRPIAVKAPTGSILNCVRPAAVRERVVAGWNVTPLVMSALAQALPDRAQAFSGYPTTLTFYGVDRDGRTYTDYLFCGGGQGASSNADGKSGLIFPTSSANTSVELTEVRAPLLVEEKSFVPDSGGPGRQRGGLAQRVVLRKLYDDGYPARIGVVPAGIDIRIPGLFGGRSGEPVSARAFDSRGRMVADLKREHWTLSDPRERIELVLAGGHGCGSAADRDASALARDMNEEYVTCGGVERDYRPGKSGLGSVHVYSDSIEREL